ncbi:MAG: hypothetical protein OXI96_09095 [Acidimicrobiaceae bacterium]|nr:hypothetical protein [Acidimicrobiaceae bacterium]
MTHRLTLCTHAILLGGTPYHTEHRPVSSQTTPLGLSARRGVEEGPLSAAPVL